MITTPERLPTIDVHIHLAGTGCCNSGIWLGPRFRNRLTFRLLRVLYGVTEHRMSYNADDYWAQMVHDTVKKSHLDYGVVLGFDGVFHSEKGHLIAHESQLIIPPKWVFDVCKRFGNLLPGPSVNPFRDDALDVLEECIAGGAVLIKWLPSAQAIDPSDERLSRFYKRLADARMPLLVHIGGERTFEEIAPGMNEIVRLIPALEQGVIVICAHSASPLAMSHERDQIPELRAALERFPNLWVDNSGMCNPGRFHNLKRLAQDELIQSRTLYGSDWPVPSNAIYFLRDWGLKAVVGLERVPNLIARDVAIKERAGFKPEMLTRANRVLANLQHWIGKGAT